MEAIAAALQGLHRAEDLLDRSASLLAHSPFSSAPQDNISLSDAAVALLQAKNSYEANLGAIKVADEIQKSTLTLIA